MNRIWQKTVVLLALMTFLLLSNGAIGGASGEAASVTQSTQLKLADGEVSSEGNSELQVFSDVDNHWARPNIEAAVAKGYVNGFPNGTFNPNDPVTAAQFLAMMFLSFTEKDADSNRVWAQWMLDKIPEWDQRHFVNNAFDFSQGKPWYTNYVNMAVFFGVINEYAYKGRYDEPLTRERAAEMIDEMDSWFNGYIKNEYAALAILNLKDANQFIEGYSKLGAKMQIRGIMLGYPDGRWQPKRSITRAEAISVIERLNNETLRKPIKPDLSGVPYSVVPNPGQPDQIFVFANWEMKKVYDETVKKLKDYPGATEHSWTTFGYYENSELMEEQIYDRNHLDLATGRVVNYDLSWAVGANTYNFLISGEPKRYERAIGTINQIMTLIFGEKASEVMKLIDDNMKVHRSNTTVNKDTIIAKRQVILYSMPGSNILTVGISGYADK